MKTRDHFVAAPMVLAALILCKVPLTAAPATARDLPRLMPAPEMALRYAAELGLSAEQQSKIAGEAAELQAAEQRLAAHVRQESGALAQLLSTEEPDEAAVAAQFEKVLSVEADVKRLRLKMSLRTRAVLTPDQQHKLEPLRRGGPSRRPNSPEQQEIVTKMARVRDLIERAKEQGRDLGAVRQMWQRVDKATREGNTTEAARILDETASSLDAALSTPAK